MKTLIPRLRSRCALLGLAGILAVGSAPAADFLIFEDDVHGVSQVQLALNNVATAHGHTVTVAADSNDFATKIATGTYEVGVVLVQQSHAPGYAAGINALGSFIAAGGKGIYADWSRDNGLAAQFGVGFTGGTNQPQVTVTDPPLAAGLPSNPFTVTNTSWGVFTTSLTPLGGATVSGTFGNGTAALVTGNAGRSLVLGFLSDTGFPAKLVENQLAIWGFTGPAGPPALPLTAVIRSGLAAPERAGRSFAGFYEYSLGSDSSLIAHTRTKGPGGLGVDQEVYSNGTGSLDLLVAEGDPTGGAGTFGSTFLDLRLGSAGDGFVFARAGGAGVTGANDFLGLADDGTSVTGYAREGTQFATLYRGLAVDSASDKGAFPAALILGGGVTAADNTGLWSAAAGDNTTAVVVQEGAVIDGTLKVGQVSPRVVSGMGSAVLHAGLTGGPAAASQAVLRCSLTSVGAPIEIVARRGDAAPGVADAVFESFVGESTAPDAGSASNGGAVFEATLKLSTLAGVTSSNNEGLWAVAPDEVDAVLLLRERDAVDGAVLKRIDRHWQLADGSVVVYGVLGGTGVTTANDAIVLRIPSGGGSPTVLLREGNAISTLGNSKIAILMRFDVSPAGAWVAQATLVNGTGDTVVANNMAVFAGNLSSADPTLSLRKGATHTADGKVKKITGFQLPDLAANSAGGTGGLGSVVNDSGDVAVGIFFNDGSQGIYVGKGTTIP